ncbi:unnamed protein product [Moneuplotes crassus]|uniref:Uncharacterized protein n=1 Tax=Euplotes crassus TaxID=5936 RepID=A0AAD1U1N6_EUPCR|nr:unnamed protein product [Moneuplotes crassus]
MKKIGCNKRRFRGVEERQNLNKRLAKDQTLDTTHPMPNLCKKTLDYSWMQKRRVLWVSPPPSSRYKKRSAKASLAMYATKKHKTSRRQICSPVSLKIQNLNLTSLDPKKISGKLKITRKMRKTPLEKIRNRIKSLSPTLKRATQIALGSSTEERKRCKKKDKVKPYNNWTSDKTILFEENMKNVYGYVFNKFGAFHSEITDLKSSSGICKSPYILNQKLEELKCSKEKIWGKDKLSRVFNDNVLANSQFKKQPS